jgi:hypothetical protein
LSDGSGPKLPRHGNFSFNDGMSTSTDSTKSAEFGGK